MEDWEQFFAEKSRRRAEKDRLARRRQRHGRTAILIVILALLAGLMVALGYSRVGGFG